jgi:hypothetical protein
MRFSWQSPTEKKKHFSTSRDTQLENHCPNPTVDCEMPFVLLLQCSTAQTKTRKKSFRKEIESEMKKEMKINTFDNCREIHGKYLL